MQVSVVMPVYNAEPYLRESIGSMLSQTFYDFELIIVNDGSTDDSLSIIKHYQAIDNRIILIDRKDNKGVAYTLNEGAAHAKGKYIARMDADDMSIANRLELQVDALKAYEEKGILLICGAWIENFYPEDGSIIPTLYAEDDIYIKLKLFLKQEVVANPVLMMPMEICERYPYPLNAKYSEDVHFYFNAIFDKKIKFYNIQQILHRRRVHEASVCSRFHAEQQVDHDNLIKKYLNAFLDEFEIKTYMDIVKHREVLDSEKNAKQAMNVFLKLKSYFLETFAVGKEPLIGKAISEMVYMFVMMQKKQFQCREFDCIGDLVGSRIESQISKGSLRKLRNQKTDHMHWWRPMMHQSKIDINCI